MEEVLDLRQLGNLFCSTDKVFDKCKLLDLCVILIDRKQYCKKKTEENMIEEEEVCE